MAYRKETSDFTVDVDGAFDVDGIWRIDAVLRFREGISDVDKSKLVGEARLAVVLGIVQAVRRGRALGATSVRVVMDSDREIVEELATIELRDPNR